MNYWNNLFSAISLKIHHWTWIVSRLFQPCEWFRIKNNILLSSCFSQDVWKQSYYICVMFLCRYCNALLCGGQLLAIIEQQICQLKLVRQGIMLEGLLSPHCWRDGSACIPGQFHQVWIQKTAAHFTNILRLTIQIQWKICFIVVQYLGIKSPQPNCHSMCKFFKDPFVSIRIRLKQSFNWIMS